jgi:Flp pilus assembly protein TadG
MIMTAILMFGIILAVGLCIDVSRVYMVRTELQNAADAAALSAARELNSGASGIQDAVTRATTIVNKGGFNRATITIAQVEFAVNLNGPYISSATAQANPGNIRFVRVTTQTTATTMLFSARALGASHEESRSATAGMSVGINTICDFFPMVVALASDPAPNSTMTLKYLPGDPGANVMKDKDYTILEVPEISGNGEKETVLLAAGITHICKSINANLQITPSANTNNGGRAIAWGANSRFDNAGKNYVDASTYPPDTNVRENISFDQYKNRTAVTPPPQNGPGVDGRRILIVPIVTPGTYQADPGPPTRRFGAFFLRKQVSTGNGSLDVEWIDETLVIGRGGYTPGGGSSNLTLPVLYR